MRIFIEKTNETKEFTFAGTGKDLLTTLNINPETILLVKNNTIVTEDESFEDKDDVKLLSVISGG
jgi:sulfur carrier protein ThiS